MFYEPKFGHGLPHNPFNAIITPRPIGWISSRSSAGTNNLAPYSFFNGVAYDPPQVMFASTGHKDSVRNIETTGVFCVNIVEFAMRDAMNATSQALPADTDEFAHAGLTVAQCDTIDCPRVAGAPASLECILTHITPIRGDNNSVIIGEVTGVHMRDDTIVDGRFDVTTFRPLSRLGYRDYSVVDNLFSLSRPDD
jgi:flavin reductase (DIM6/NTAB) family NADH-FMN oxidoreductase RutF